MFRALQTASLGMSSQQLKVDNISNNLANVNTTGFKRSDIAFQDLFYQTLSSSSQGSSVNNPANDAPELQIGHGSRPVADTRNFMQGSLEETGNSMDMAIDGDGFFMIEKTDGSIAYTRDGDFNLNSTGEIVNSSGLPLADYIEVPEDAVGISISQDGVVTAQIDGEASPMDLGQIEMAKFINPAGLRAEGGNLFAETEASGPPMIGIPGMDGFGGIQQGYLEQSNVDIVNEMVSLITAQRAYETNSKMVQTAEDMMAMTNQIKR